MQLFVDVNRPLAWFTSGAVTVSSPGAEYQNDTDTSRDHSTRARARRPAHTRESRAKRSERGPLLVGEEIDGRREIACCRRGRAVGERRGSSATRKRHIIAYGPGYCASCEGTLSDAIKKPE
ncbi:hypothetical protein EVAR_95279_1 [Eumeta japonica]|uniref:Uncharacterized protein n=1 Tax=Eumeta variegata TaxID=151549 RepID=A0A4C1UL11_EUMVA|nr:hypothetical protein EVAR_95279_1 [Eumeta japonica]